jgi:hypothetical protein
MEKAQKKNKKSECKQQIRRRFRARTSMQANRADSWLR